MANVARIDKNRDDFKPPYQYKEEPDVEEVNVSGHVPVLPKRFNLLSAIATGIITGNTWTALGGAIVRPSAIHIII
jgi:choline transport protein